MSTNAIAYAVVNTLFGLYKNDEALVETLNLKVIEAYERWAVQLNKDYRIAVCATLGRGNRFTIAELIDKADKIKLACVVPDTIYFEVHSRDKCGTLEDYLEVGDSYPCILRDSSDGTVKGSKTIFVKNTMAVTFSIGNKLYFLSPNYVFESDVVRSRIGPLFTLLAGKTAANIIKKTRVEDFITAYEKDKETIEKANKLHKIARVYLETTQKYKEQGVEVLNAAYKKLDAIYTSIPVCERIKLNTTNADISTWSREQIVSFFNSIGYTQGNSNWITKQLQSKLTTGSAIALNNGDKLETYTCNAVIKHMSNKALMPAGIGSTVVMYKDAQGIIRYCWSLGKLPFEDLQNYIVRAIEYNQNADKKDRFTFIASKTGEVTLGYELKKKLGLDDGESYNAFMMYVLQDLTVASGTIRVAKARIVVKRSRRWFTLSGSPDNFDTGEVFKDAYEDLKMRGWEKIGDKNTFLTPKQIIVANTILDYKLRRHMFAPADTFRGMPFGGVRVNLDGNFIGHSGLPKSSSEAAYLDTESQNDRFSDSILKRLIQSALAQGCDQFKLLTDVIKAAESETMIVAAKAQSKLYEYAFGLGIPTFYAEANGISTEAPTSIQLNCEDLYTAKDLQVQSATATVNMSNGIYDELDDEEELEGYLDEDDELEDDDFGSDDFDTLDDIDEQAPTEDGGFDSFDELDEDMDELDGEEVYSEEVADDESDEAHITVTTDDGAAILNWKEVLRLNFQLRDATDLRLTEIWTTMLTSAKQNDISEKELLSMLYTRFTGEEAD